MTPFFLGDVFSAGAAFGAPFFFAAHRAFNVAEIFARASGVIPPFLGFAAGLAAGAGFVPLILAQRALRAAAILARASGDMVFGPILAGADALEETGLPAPIEFNRASSFAICSLIWMASLC